MGQRKGNSSRSMTHRVNNTAPVFYSISTMLPQQDEECWDNNDVDPVNNKKGTLLYEGAKNGRGTNIKGIKMVNNGRDLRKQHRQLSVHFPPESSLVTAIHTRPRTYHLDLDSLHYSKKDIKQFRNDYKRKMYAEALAQKMAQDRKQVWQPHDNSYWRTKVHRQWHHHRHGLSDSPSTGTTSTSSVWKPMNDVGSVLVPFSDNNDEESECAITDLTSNDDDDYDGCTDNDDDEDCSCSAVSTSASDIDSYDSEDEEGLSHDHTSPGVLSSVIGVAREAASLLNRPASSMLW